MVGHAGGRDAMPRGIPRRQPCQGRAGCVGSARAHCAVDHAIADGSAILIVIIHRVTAGHSDAVLMNGVERHCVVSTHVCWGHRHADTQAILQCARRQWICPRQRPRLQPHANQWRDGPLSAHLMQRERGTSDSAYLRSLIWRKHEAAARVDKRERRGQPPRRRRGEKAMDALDSSRSGRHNCMRTRLGTPRSRQHPTERTLHWAAAGRKAQERSFHDERTSKVDEAYK